MKKKRMKVLSFSIITVILVGLGSSYHRTLAVEPEPAIFVTKSVNYFPQSIKQNGFTYNLGSVFDTSIDAAGVAKTQCGYNYICVKADDPAVVYREDWTGPRDYTYPYDPIEPDEKTVEGDPMSYPRRDNTKNIEWTYKGYSGMLSTPATGGFTVHWDDTELWNNPLAEPKIPPKLTVTYTDINGVVHNVPTPSLEEREEEHILYRADPGNKFIPPRVGQQNEVLTIYYTANLEFKLTQYTAIYYYSAPTVGTVTVEHIDESTGTKLIDDEVYTNVFPGNHTYNAKTIQGYTVQGNSSQTINVVAGQTHKVTFKYKKSAGTITINYLEKDTNNVLKSPKVLTNVPQGSATYTAENIDGYVAVAPTSQTINVEPGKSYSITFRYIKLKAPTVTISAPTTVYVGDDVHLSGYGTTQNSYVTSLQGVINIGNASGVGGNNTIYGDVTTFPEGSTNKSTSFGGYTWFSKVGSYPVWASVTDNFGSSAASDTKYINAVLPAPNVIIKNSGTLKENRKIVIDASTSNGGSARSTIDWTSAKWTIEAIVNTGGSNTDIRVQKHTTGATNGEILIDSSRSINKSLNGLSTFDVLFKKKGEYKITLSLKNNYGVSASKEIVLYIQEDVLPTAAVYTTGSTYRNPNDKTSNGLAQATIEVNDSSKSYDDTIVKRAYIFAFDTNNDKNYSDEMAYVYDLNYNGVNQIPNEGSLNPHLRPLCKVKDLSTIDFSSYNTGNLTTVSIKTTRVGGWITGIYVKEEFAQETIPQFVTAADRRSNNNFD